MKRKASVGQGSWPAGRCGQRCVRWLLTCAGTGRLGAARRGGGDRTGRRTGRTSVSPADARPHVRPRQHGRRRRRE